MNKSEKELIETLSQKNEALLKLNNFSIGLSKLSSNDDLETFITKQIVAITDAAVATFSEFDSVNRTLTVQHIEIESGILEKLVTLLGKRYIRFIRL